MENDIKRILIVEDQVGPLDALEKAVEKIGPEYFGKYECHTARWYTQAEDKINQTSYDLVLLDHRMPYDDPRSTEDDEDMGDKFFSTLKNIGYELIDKIKEKDSRTIVVGTSSLSERDTGSFTNPDYIMRKFCGAAEEDLEKILTSTERGTN